jgi:hypothetical protein
MVLPFPSSLMGKEISWNHRGTETEKNPVISSGFSALKPKYYVTVVKWDTHEVFGHLELSALDPQCMIPPFLPFSLVINSAGPVTCGSG